MLDEMFNIFRRRTPKKILRRVLHFNMLKQEVHIQFSVNAFNYQC